MLTTHFYNTSQFVRLLVRKMIPTSRITFLNYIQPLLPISRCLGISIFTIAAKSGNGFLTYLSYFLYVIIIIFIFRCGYTSSKNFFLVNYVNRSDVNMISRFVVHICISFDYILRYIVYLLYRQRIKTFLVHIDRLDEILQIDRSKSPNLNKQIAIFAGIVTMITVLALGLLASSSTTTSFIEMTIYYTSHSLFFNCELFVIRVYFHEVSKLFSSINENIRTSSDVPHMISLIKLSKCHHELSRLILKSNNLFNTSIIGVLLAFVLMFTTGTEVGMLNIKIWIENHPIDVNFVVWNFTMGGIVLFYTWYLIKIRMGVINEVRKFASH